MDGPWCPPPRAGGTRTDRALTSTQGSWQLCNQLGCFAIKPRHGSLRGQGRCLPAGRARRRSVIIPEPEVTTSNLKLIPKTYIKDIDLSELSRMDLSEIEFVIDRVLKGLMGIREMTDQNCSSSSTKPDAPRRPPLSVDDLLGILDPIDGVFFLDFLSAVESRVVNWSVVTKGEDERRSLEFPDSATHYGNMFLPVNFPEMLSWKTIRLAYSFTIEIYTDFCISSVLSKMTCRGSGIIADLLFARPAGRRLCTHRHKKDDGGNTHRRLNEYVRLCVSTDPEADQNDSIVEIEVDLRVIIGICWRADGSAELVEKALLMNFDLRWSVEVCGLK
ncbi:hypothetical protein Syun_031800 [Stephania yunnanensis]|uniref:Uncharacterized protein n=1 Tax=Stephania yunnanensis TaxID=152371 RepID=A0AAP0DV83_9MAGN